MNTPLVQIHTTATVSLDSTTSSFFICHLRFFSHPEFCYPDSVGEANGFTDQSLVPGNGLAADFNEGTNWVSVLPSPATSPSGNEVTVSTWLFFEKLPSQAPGDRQIFDSSQDTHIFYPDSAQAKLRFIVKILMDQLVVLGAYLG